MKIIPITTTNGTVFHGLWEKSTERSAGYDGHINNVRVDRTYHPFANESEDAIKSALALKKYRVLVPTDNEYEFNNVISEPVSAKRLSFTENEYLSYKKFYGKELPESMKKIEKELVDCNLARYLNSKSISAIKRFLHSIKII